MRVLGIDPGLTRLGHGAVSLVDGEKFLIGHGLINHPRDPSHTFNQHLNAGILQITNDLPKLLDIINPTLVCAELVPPGRLSANSELVVAAITACKVIVYQFGIEWVDFGANTIKKTVTGDGTATKAKVKNAVIAEFPQIGERHKLVKAEQKAEGVKATGLPQDCFDAVAVALTGIELHEFNSRPKAQDPQRDLPELSNV